MDELHYGWRELAAISIAISIIGTWALVRYRVLRAGQGIPQTHPESRPDQGPPPSS